MILRATDRAHRGLCLAGQICFWIPLTPGVDLPGSGNAIALRLLNSPLTFHPRQLISPLSWGWSLACTSGDPHTEHGHPSLRPPVFQDSGPQVLGSPLLIPAACLCILWPWALALLPCALTTGREEPGLTGPPLSPLESQWLRLFAGVFSWVSLVGQRNSL